MEQKEIIEGNRLIARFNGDFGNDGVVDYYIRHDGFQHESGEFLDYHKNWSTLMPVVEKIESLDDVDFILICKTYMNINRKTSIIEETLSNPSKIMGRGKTFLETVYSAVLQFIQFYNALNK